MERRLAVRRAILIIGLAVLGLLVPWQLGYDPSLLAATTNYAVGWTTVRPSPVVAGTSARIETRVQARVAGTATVELSARNAQGTVVWQQTWSNQTFGAWQSRTYYADWSVPATQPAGAHTLVVRVLAGSPAAEVTSRTASFSVSGVVGGAGSTPLAPTATPAPSQPTPTPAPASSTPITITGSASYVSNIRAALELMRSKSPADYQMVTTYVREIREGSNLAYVGAKIIQVSTTSSLSGREWAGGTIVHEATHVMNYQTGNFPYAGCDGEAKSLRAQAAYLNKVGASALAQQVLALIGVWC
jgi:hypothetical protein